MENNVNNIVEPDFDKVQIQNDILYLWGKCKKILEENNIPNSDEMASIVGEYISYNILNK